MVFFCRPHSPEEIGPRSVKVLHKESIANKSGIANEMSDTGGCVTLGKQPLDPHIADVKPIAIFKKAVKLAASHLKLGAGFEDCAKHFLHCDDI